MTTSQAGVQKNLEEVSSLVEIVRRSVADRATCDRAVRGVDTVFHLAAKITQAPGGGDISAFDAVNSGGTANLLASCAAARQVRQKRTQFMGPPARGTSGTAARTRQ